MNYTNKKRSLASIELANEVQTSTFISVLSCYANDTVGWVKVGQVVKLLNGTSEAEIIEIRQQINNLNKSAVLMKYKSGCYWNLAEKIGFVIKNCASDENSDSIDEDQNGERSMSMQGKLFQVKEGEDQFGTWLTRNSHGQVILEMKGKDGEVKAFNEDEIEQVIPYTVKIENDHRDAHIQVVKGKLKKDDLILVGYCIWRVTKLDTKREHAERLTGPILKIKTEKIGNSEDD